MSWSIYSTGLKENVAKDVEKASSHGGGDRKQFEAAKAFILAEVAASPRGGANGVIVEAFGHNDDKSRNIHIKIQPLALATEPDESK